VIADAALLVHADRDGLVRATNDGFAITERGRPFARTTAARFDAYLAGSRARHSLAV
jgi:oxygen-independent coproporphyrinogen III oxidase